MDGLEPSASAYRELFRCLLPLYPVSDLPLSYTTKWSRVLESNQSPPFCRGVITTSYVTRHLKIGARWGNRTPVSTLAMSYSTTKLISQNGAKCGNRTRLSSLQDQHITIYVYSAYINLAENIGFEPMDPFGSGLQQSPALDHSANFPYSKNGGSCRY